MNVTYHTLALSKYAYFTITNGFKNNIKNQTL